MAVRAFEFFIVYCLGSVIQRTTGFGMGIFAIAVLPYFVGSHTTVAAVTGLVAVFSSTEIAWELRKSIRWRMIPSILAGSMIFTAVSVWFAKGASFELLEKILGAVLILLAAVLTFSGKKLRIRQSVPAGFLAGSAGGILNGLFATGGPPVVMYLFGAIEDYTVYLATLQAYFAVNNYYAALVRFLNGIITKEVLFGLLFGGLGMLLGNHVGRLLLPHVPSKALRGMIYALMAVCGINMLL